MFKKHTPPEDIKTSQTEEIKQLKKEIKDLKEEKEYLKSKMEKELGQTFTKQMIDRAHLELAIKKTNKKLETRDWN